MERSKLSEEKLGHFLFANKLNFSSIYQVLTINPETLSKCPTFLVKSGSLCVIAILAIRVSKSPISLPSDLSSFASLPYLSQAWVDSSKRTSRLSSSLTFSASLLLFLDLYAPSNKSEAESGSLSLSLPRSRPSTALELHFHRLAEDLQETMYPCRPR